MRMSEEVADATSALTVIFGMVLFLALAISRPSSAVVLGVQEDKAWHFFGGYVGSHVASEVFGKKAFKAPPITCRWLALAAGMTLATAKEGLDATQPGEGWDWQDWTSTALGCGVEIIIGW